MPKKIKLSKLTFTIDDDDSLSKKAISAIVTKFNGKISPRLSKTTNFLITTKNQIKKNKRNVQKASKLKIKCIPVEALFMNNLMKQKQNDNFWEKDNNNVIRLYNGAESCFLKLNKNELTIQNKIKKKIIRKKLKFPNENLAEKSLFKNILECAKNNFCTFKPKKKIFEKSKSVDFKFDRKTSTQKSESVPKFIFKNYKKSPKQYEFMRQSEFKSEIAVNSKRKIDFYSPLFQIEKLAKTNEKQKNGSKYLKKEFENSRNHKTIIFKIGTVIIRDIAASSENTNFFTELNEFAAIKTFDRLCNELEKNGYRCKSSKIGKSRVFESEKDFSKRWWHNLFETRKILAKNGLFIFSRTVFNSFADFEALDDPINMDQIEVALANTNFIPKLAERHFMNTGQSISYHQLSQKYYSVKLLFEYGHEIGFMLGDFVKFYHFDNYARNKNKKKSPKPVFLMMVYFIIDGDFGKSKILGYVFDDDSADIKFSLDGLGESDNIAVSLLKNAVKGDVHLAIK